MEVSLAKRVARSVEREVRAALQRDGLADTLYIGADGEDTYRLDDLAEKAALQALEGESVAVLSEESGLMFLDAKPEHLCLLDPLDGSTNAVKGIPFYCTSVAFAPWSGEASLQDVTAGVVLNLVTGDLFSAEKTRGARLNGRRIKVGLKTLDKPLVASLYLRSNLGLQRLFEKVRCMGAVALELAHVAAGGIDALIDERGHLKVTDVAAGKLLVEEAGGVVTDLEGNLLNQCATKLNRVSLVASGSRAVHDKVLCEARA